MFFMPDCHVPKSYLNLGVFSKKYSVVALTNKLSGLRSILPFPPFFSFVSVFLNLAKSGLLKIPKISLFCSKIIKFWNFGE